MPAKSILKYFGAKWSSSQKIVTLLPTKHRYVEPYCGSASVYFNLPWCPKHVVLNDLNGDIIHLFQVLREQPEQLIRAIELTPWSEVEHLRSWEPTEEPIERARRFLSRQWMNHGGALLKAGFRHRGNKEVNTSTTCVWNDLPNRLWEVVEPLKQAEIRCRSALEIIHYYNTHDTVFYIDPPYPLSTRNNTTRYTHEMSDKEHIELLDCLQNHNSAIVLSGYDCPLYNERLHDWERIEFIALADGGRQRTEVLWLKNITVEQQMIMDFAR